MCKPPKTHCYAFIFVHIKTCEKILNPYAKKNTQAFFILNSAPASRNQNKHDEIAKLKARHMWRINRNRSKNKKKTTE